ncbi:MULTISPECIES: glutathione-disulfide reductase [Cyanophyceae]|uniref:glutathione-disulfide reductase n=1 Tax=Cyanophyceae TaxID=3028117 RepID=UPI0016880CFF|nr:MULTISPECIES: glutathione-disulfide reductase [unclassified Phormidium]MBD1917103.1 glutathione-disulfide reductase [Phormidium sp. FACHB-77]MBD2030634.1 glutathione-disulfide reductase [Phormidium sp. FACHB-322]MBD2050258.1 glutathione-disulfide reductase [Leptolyngbya sp. FACHB-60]
MTYDFDLLVIGGGSGGIAAARRAASHGARVGLAEARQLGGTCVNRGCLPKKLMVYAAQFAEQSEVATSYGWVLGQQQFDWPTLINAVDQEVDRLRVVYQDLLDKSGVEIFHHQAQFVDEHTLAMGETTVTAAKILIAAGGQPTRPNNISGIEHAITSDDIFHLPHQPKRIVIIGGGYIGCEFASILNGLGTEVTQIIHGDKILSGFDDDLRHEIHGAMQRRGITMVTNSEQIAIAPGESGLTLTVTTEQGQKTVLSDAVSLAATGRNPNVKGLGLENTGVTLNQGAIAVDAHYRTTVPHIFAIGDIIDRVTLTPVAIREGRLFADAEFDHQPATLDYDTIPTAVFTTPELGSVGFTEAEAKKKFGKDDVQTYCSRFQPLYYRPSDREPQGLIKLVVQKSTDRVLGAHMVGNHAAELMQGVAIAVTMGATKADFDTTLAIHPTTAEEFIGLG